MHINPDHFLETDMGRVVNRDRSREAWQLCYKAFYKALSEANQDTKLFILIGAQGAGKSTWAHQFADDNPDAIIFDAILVKQIERMPIIQAAVASSIEVIAVWFKTSLPMCCQRNASRPPNEIVAEQALRNVFIALEPPTFAEGFVKIIEVPESQLSV